MCSIGCYSYEKALSSNAALYFETWFSESARRSCNMLQFWRKCKLFNNHCKLEHTIELSIKVTKNICVCYQIHFFEQNTIGIGQQNCNHCIFTLRKIILMRCMRYTGLIFWEWEHWCQLVLGTSRSLSWGHGHIIGIEKTSRKHLR